jgi:formylglycine-generating enzyme required for sulfatase activity
MSLTESDLRRIARVARGRHLGFVELVHLAELDPGTAFRGATLRGRLSGQRLNGFDFTNAVFLEGSDFSFADTTDCDLTGADLTYVRGVTRAMLEAAITDGTTKQPRALFWASGQPPSWAEDWGRDAYGPWCTFRVPNTEVTQRLRWCPPGTFLMGSPETEPDRYDDEGPQHEVTFAEGFWIFETAVTEALWSAVMGGSASRRRLPKTKIDWNQAREFAEKLNILVPGLSLGLPSEAAWEYACRAGTDTPYSFGESIAKKQVNHEGRGRVAVGTLPPNPWGLHEMHGNVDEWCEDGWENNYDDAPTYGAARPPDGAAARVVRGGSWSDVARVVRAAYRFDFVPSYRDDGLGFRCARVQREHSDSGGGVAAPADLARERSAERATGQGRGRRHSAGAAEATRTPVWAKRIGTDEYGTYADLAIPTGKGRFVPQRMRLIEPGTFMMSSPAYEPSRLPSEGPVHEVKIERGFWLFDSPCTQSLWRAVMGKNPSYFKSAQRPVESVSFVGVATFLSAVNDRVNDLNLILPSEAQWEYACRAGSHDATYAGPMEILGDINAPVLDAIAWYGGNSGVEYDLKRGHDSTGWLEKQYPHAKAGSRIVKQKLPNRWGLYDMLGNVWEWCADEWHGNYDGAPTDGSAWIADSDGTADRVVRGGSWHSDARFVRSAYRGRFPPSNRNDSIGFRGARVLA